MRITPDPFRVACPFVSCLEAAVLGDETEFLVPDAVFDWNIRPLRKAIGRGATDFYSAQIDGKIYNLETKIGWRELFKNIRLSDNRTALDISNVPVPLHKYFDRLKIASVRPDIYMLPPDPNRQKEILGYSDLASAHFFAKGKLEGILPEDMEMVNALQQIYKFICKKSIVFDPEEATAYLLRLCTVTKNKGSASQMSERAVESAVSNFFHCAMGEYIVNAQRYNATGINLVPAFEDHEILASMISYRTGTHHALSKVSRFDPPYTDSFFAKLTPYIDDPSRLYAFERVAKLLVGIAHISPGIVLGNLNAIIHVHRKGKDLVKMLDDNELSPEFDEICEMMREQGKPTGASVARLAAAVQINEVATTNILEQYRLGASTLNARMPFPVQPADNSQAVRYRLGIPYLHGVQEGMIEEVQKLLHDRSSIAHLRQKAENLHI